MEYEGDQGHFEIACKECGLKPGSKSIRLPGSNERYCEKEEMAGKPGGSEGESPG